MTSKQLAVLLLIMEGQSMGFTPTISDMADRFGVRRNAIQQHLRALQKKGFISRNCGEHRAVNVNCRLFLFRHKELTA